MPAPHEIQFAQLAVRRRLITKEQGEECLRAQQAAEQAGQEVNIAQVFIEKGVITNEQLQQLYQWWEQAIQQTQAVQQTPPTGQPAQAAPSQAEPAPPASTGQTPTGVTPQPAQETPTQKTPTGAQKAQTRPTSRTVKLPGYEIVEKIGQGGMGAVYKARQTSMNRVVALKILPPKLAKIDRFVKRFIREAQSAGKLDHRNIVRGVDVGQAEGLYYFAMEFVEGDTLRKIIKTQGKIGEEQAADIVLQIARGLEHAHEQKIVHRDIKPDNIMLTNDGVAKLTDLGLAKSTTGETDITVAGATYGTPDYVSPEQAKGGDETIDTISDMYSLGATFFHMVTGRVPYPGESATVVMTKHMNEKLQSPKELVPELTDHVCNVIQKMMAKRREDRYQNPTELIEDLEQVKAGAAPTKAAELAASSRAKERVSAARRAKYTSQKKFIAGVIVAAVLVIGGVSYAVYKLRGEPETKVIKETKYVNVGGNTTVEAGPTEAETAFQNAEDYYKENPTDYQKCVEYFQGAKGAEGGAELMVEADKRIDEILAAREAAAKKALEPLMAKADELAAALAYQDAIEELSKLDAVFTAVGSLPDTAAASEVGPAKAKHAQDAQKLFEARKAAADELVAQAEQDLTKLDEAIAKIEEAKVCGMPKVLESVEAACEEYRVRKREISDKAAGKVKEEWEKEISPKLASALGEENWELALTILRKYADDPNYAAVRDPLKEQCEEVIPYAIFRDKVDEVLSKCVGSEEKTIPSRRGTKRTLIEFADGTMKLQNPGGEATTARTVGEEFIFDPQDRPRLNYILREYLIGDYGKNDPESYLAIAAYEYFLDQPKGPEDVSARIRTMGAAIKKAEELGGQNEALAGRIAWYKERLGDLSAAGGEKTAEKLYEAIQAANDKRNYTGAGGVLDLIKRMERSCRRTELYQQLKGELGAMKARALAASEMKISDIYHAAKFDHDRDGGVRVTYDFTDDKQLDDFVGGWKYALQLAKEPKGLYVIGTGVFTRVPYTGDLQCLVSGVPTQEMHVSICAEKTEDTDKSKVLRYPGYYIVLKKNLAQIYRETPGENPKDRKPVAEEKTSAFRPNESMTIKIEYKEMPKGDDTISRLLVSMERPRRAKLVWYEDKDPLTRNPLAGRIGLYGRPGNFGAGKACTYTGLMIRAKPATAWIDNELARLADDKSEVKLAFQQADAKKGGLIGYYYAGVNFDAVKMARIDPSINFNWALKSPHASVPAEQFSVKWRGLINVPQSGMTLHVAQDDGVRIYLRGELIYDRWHDVSPATKRSPVDKKLTKGLQPIEVWFFDALMHASVQIWWSKPGSKLELPIPPDALYYSGTLAAQYTLEPEKK